MVSVRWGGQYRLQYCNEHIELLLDSLDNYMA